MRRDNRRSDANAAAAFWLCVFPDVFQHPLMDPSDAMSFTSAAVVGVVEALRKAVASGEDVSVFFGEWSGLERQIETGAGSGD